ncbi:MAG: SGNH/GDSL hydrolase family protein [Clostridia bacterium]|nr:SGNH/GDSL hydrolase family protein [Clostridia bacterium]
MKKRVIRGIIAMLTVSTLLSGCHDAPEPNQSTINTQETEAESTLNSVEDHGKFSIDDIYAWVGCPASDFVPMFEKPQFEEVLTYSYDESALRIDADKCTVKALKAGKYKVTATSESFSTSFTVKANTIDKSSPKYDMGTYDYLSYANSLKKTWEKEGTPGETTLFIGDSYMDVRSHAEHLCNSLCAEDDVLCFGIGRTSSYNWEILVSSLLAHTAPKAIVINVGTNNVYNEGDTDKTGVEALQRLFTMIHAKFPNTPIYWYDITQRSYNEAYQKTVAAINEEMREWCAQRDWITCVMVSDQISNDMLSDNVHVKAEHYNIFYDSVIEAGLELSKKK